MTLVTESSLIVRWDRDRRASPAHAGGELPTNGGVGRVALGF